MLKVMLNRTIGSSASGEKKSGQYDDTMKTTQEDAGKTHGGGGLNVNNGA